MTKLIFKFDIEKDLHNIWETCNEKTWYGHDFKKFVSKDIMKICKGKEFGDCKIELKKRYKKLHENSILKTAPNLFNESWKKIEKEYFSRLKKIMKKPFYCEKVLVYLTTFGRCPYRPHKNPPYFYVNVFSNIFKVMGTSGHELMHLQFHNQCWESVEKELGYRKTHDLKEALTVLLNIEFQDLWVLGENGYPNHQKLREFIIKEWKKKKDFEVLLDKCIKYMKK